MSHLEGQIASEAGSSHLWCIIRSALTAHSPGWELHLRSYTRGLVHSVGTKSSNYHPVVLISHASKVIMIKILQARLQQYINQELPNVQVGFWKGRGTRDQIANICWITEQAREFQKNIYFWFIDYANAFDCVDHNKLWKNVRDEYTRPP